MTFGTRLLHKGKGIPGTIGFPVRRSKSYGSGVFLSVSLTNFLHENKNSRESCDELGRELSRGNEGA